MRKSKKPKSSSSKNGSHLTMPKTETSSSDSQLVQRCRQRIPKDLSRRAGSDLSRKRKWNKRGGHAGHRTDPTELITVKCVSRIWTKNTCIPSLKLTTFKIWIMNKKYINFACKFHLYLLLVTAATERTNWFLYVLKNWLTTNRPNKTNSRHMRQATISWGKASAQSSSNTKKKKKKEFTEHNHRNHNLKRGTWMICLIIVSKRLLPI